ncbi:MAG TPA: DNRLRE domain-containing protein [Verrucomicrobiota bacterium]|nr:DNRLRE domain-containing protein [Verrucomicrobiota bacterium]
MKNITDINTSGLLRGGTTHLNLMRALVVLVMTMLLGLALPQAQAAHGIAAALLRVDVGGGGNPANENITVTPELSINGFLPYKYDAGGTTWNTADYYVQIGETKADDVAKGVLITSVADNGRVQWGPGGTNVLGYAISTINVSGAGYRITTGTTNVSGTGGSTREWNSDVAAAWFPYDRYLAAHCLNSANGGVITTITGSPEVVLGTTFIDCIPDGSGGCAAQGGEFTLDLRSYGIDSMTDGILLVNGGKEEPNFALSEAQPDGTWKLFVHDVSTGSAGNYEQDPIAFVYIPRTDTSVISGKLDGDGGIIMHSGNSPQFTTSKLSNGRHLLTMTGYAATNGVLIISPEGGGTYNLDNVVSYEITPDGQSFELQSRDTPNFGLQSPYKLLGGVRYPEAAFSFVFIPAPTEVGFEVWPQANLLTAETPNAYYTDPVTNTFTVHLTAKPTADVTISGIASSDATEGVVCEDLTSLTFTPENWWMPQTVKVTGLDDGDVDGQVAYSIVLPAATSADARYNGLNPADVGCLNADNEAGISVSATSLTTSEGGLQATFQVALNTAPTTDDTTIGLASSDTTEGTVEPASLTFTSLNWSNAQTVTITGVDDAVIDGDIAYTIVTGAATSTDPAYNGLDALDVGVVNLDNDAPGLAITPKGMLTVSEPNSTVDLNVALSCQPSADVTVSISSGDTSEGTTSPASRTFTPANWDTAQTFTLTAADDVLTDGTVGYTLTLTTSSSAPGWSGVTVVVPAQTLDNEPEFTLPSGTLYYGIEWPGMVIDGQATIVDADATDYDTGSLTVTLTVNGQSNDRLEIRNQGTDWQQIGVSGDTVTYSGVPIGTYSGGVGTTPLVVLFNASANPEAAQALAQNITYYNVTNAPLQDPRTVVFELADGDGATSSDSKQIVVSKVHISDFQYGKDAGFGVYTGAKDCEIYSLIDEYMSYPMGTWSDPENELYGLVVHINKNTLEGYDQQVLLRFDDIVGTNPGQIPPGSTLVSAELMLYVVNGGDGSPLHRMLVDWDSEASTWNNLGSGVQIDGIEAETAYYSQFNASNRSGSTGVGQIRFSVLPDVQAWVNGTANYGWVMPTWGTATGNDNTIFAPAEATNLVTRPRLLVKWLPAEATIKAASFRQGQDGYTGTVDTRIREVSPDTEFSAVTGMSVDYEVNPPAEDSEHLLLRFDDIFGTGAGQVPPFAKIHAAVLDLTSTGSDNMGDGGTFHRMLIPWEATTATWNFFVEGIQADDEEAVSVPTLAAGNETRDPNVQGGWNTFEVTTDVQLFANGTANYGWVVLPWPYGADGWAFYTADHGTLENHPQLRVYYTSTRPVMKTVVLTGSPATSAEVSFEGEPGKTYEVWRSPAVAGAGVSWTTKVGEATPDVNGNASVVDSSPLADAAYYRARVK